MLNLSQVAVRPVLPSEEAAFQGLMQQYHYLGYLPKIGNTIWYVATINNDWLGLLSFSAAALKCSARDRWIGWGHRLQYDRLNLVANNSRFLILPNCHFKNLATKILSLCRKRIQRDWQEHFGFPLLILETFVDPSRFVGTIYSGPHISDSSLSCAQPQGTRNHERSEEKKVPYSRIQGKGSSGGIARGQDCQRNRPGIRCSSRYGRPVEKRDTGTSQNVV